MPYAILTVRNNRNVWMPLAQLPRAIAAKPDYWWRKDYTSLRRNTLNNDLVDRFDAICGEVIDPRRYTEQELEDQIALKLAA